MRTVYDNCPPEINTLLIRRLRGSGLRDAQAIAADAMAELGGGPARVRQRLRSTLEWCEDGSYPGLMFDASQQELSKSWAYRPGGSPHTNAAAQHLAHARTVQAVAQELRLSCDLRRGLVNAAKGAAASASRLAQKNSSDKKNRALALQGEKYRVDYVKHKKIQRQGDNSRRRNRYSKLLRRLQEDGWIVAFTTITLPRSFHHKNSRIWGLAGSPQPELMAYLLREIHKAAIPKRAAKEFLGGFWRIDKHESGVLHLHAPVAFRDEHELQKYQQKLKAAYYRLTAPWLSLRVLGAFGIGVQVDWQHAIVTKVCGNTEKDIKKVVGYSLKGLEAEIDLTPGSRHAAIGCLRGTQDQDQDKQLEPSQTLLNQLVQQVRHTIATIGASFIPIKLYQEENDLCQSLAFSPKSSVLLPPARAPPSISPSAGVAHQRPFKGRITNKTNCLKININHFVFNDLHKFIVLCIIVSSLKMEYAMLNHQSHHGAPKQVRRRLTPVEQIDAAKASLARAQRRQRQHDTRCKVVLGGFVLAWIRSNSNAAKSLLQRLNTNPPRDQDKDALSQVRDELIQIVGSANGQPHVDA